MEKKIFHTKDEKTFQFGTYICRVTPFDLFMEGVTFHYTRTEVYNGGKHIYSLENGFMGRTAAMVALRNAKRQEAHARFLDKIAMSV